MELGVIFAISLLLGTYIYTTAPKTVRATASVGTVDLRSLTPVQGFYEVESMDAAPTVILAPAPGLYAIAAAGRSMGPTGMIDGPPVPRVTYIAAVAMSGARATKQVTVLDGHTTIVDFGVIAQAVTSNQEPAMKAAVTIPSATPVAPIAIPSLRIQGMPWGGRVVLNGVGVGGRWEDEPAKTQWRVNATIGPVTVEVIDPAGVRRIATTDIPDPSRGFATVDYARMGATMIEGGGYRAAGGAPPISALTPRAEIAAPVVPVLFTGGLVGPGIALPSRFTVTFRYEPGTYFHRDAGGTWDSAFRLSIARGPKGDGIESETRFSLSRAATDSRVSQATYNARQAFEQVSYRNGTSQRGYLHESGNASAPASLFAEPSLPIASKSSRSVTFEVDAPNGRISIANNYSNGGVEETIGVRRDTGEFFLGVQTRAPIPNGFIITRPPALGEESSTYVAIARGETKEFSLSTSATAPSTTPYLGGLVALIAPRNDSPATQPAVKPTTIGSQVTLFQQVGDSNTMRLGS